MTRPTFPDIFAELSRRLAERSTCLRLQVGTVITTTDYRKVLSVGYNGNASGLPNKCDSDEPGGCGCIHSEANAVINCDAPRYVGKIVFITHSPCVMCAKMLVNLGRVQRVYYNETYRSTLGLEVLALAKIKTERIGIPCTN